MKILFIDILTGNKKTREKINLQIYDKGNYPESVRKAFGLKKNQWYSIDASKEKLPQNISSFNAVVMGGSTQDPIEKYETEWMKKTYQFIRFLVKKEIPILGICGGMQFTARALGAEVILNPNGRILGNTKVKLTALGKKDLLFRGLPENITFQSSHKYVIKKALPGWKILASSPLCKNQAIAINKKIKLVQFHLELSKKEIQKIALMRKKALIKEGFLKNEADFEKFIKSIKDVEKNGKKVLSNFLTLAK